MTTMTDRSDAGSEQYLDAMVRTASPARLRLMMIERAIEVAATLSVTWLEKRDLGSNEHSLRLLDLLNELLAGVTGGASDSETRLCSQVADLYVFLIQHLVGAEAGSDSSAVDEIRIVLETEAGTWRAVCANEVPAKIASPAPSSLNFEA